jgi:hypothetical protein
VASADIQQARSPRTHFRSVAAFLFATPPFFLCRVLFVTSSGSLRPASIARVLTPDQIPHHREASIMGLAQTYRNVTSTFHHNHLGYQPLFPLGSIAQVVQTKSSQIASGIVHHCYYLCTVFVRESHPLRVRCCVLQSERLLTSTCIRIIVVVV